MYSPQAIAIHKALLDHGLLVADVARALDVAPDVISKLIHGYRPLYRLRKPLAELLDVGVDDLFPGEGERVAARARRAS